MLPTSVKIGPFVYKIVHWASSPNKDDVEEQLGEFNHITLQISIRTDVPPEIQAETLLHECIHAVWCVMMVDKSRRDEEAVVSRLSMGLYTVFKENPDVASFILRPIQYEAS